MEYFSTFLSNLLIFSFEKQEDFIPIKSEEQVELPYTKTINLTNQDGNTLCFDIYCDNQTLLNKFSEENYTFSGMTE